ncbi:MAG TPA: hypothetical protein VGO71_10040 [Baekduia sp.]|jgi:hypothetical protein|nr:hypothetical protein [Baekduia sp.]
MSVSPRAERRIVTCVPPIMVALLVLPFALHQNAWYEWETAYWLLERQAAHVSAHGTPSFFLHTKDGAFYPFNLFYGGFTIGLLAYPAAVLGAWSVFVASMAGALVAGYLGIWWAACNLGLTRRLAVLPALAYVTTPYVLSDAYGRGAWAELVGVNAVAVMLGGLTALVLERQRRRLPALTALVASGAIVAGTHNLTLIMTAAVLPLLMLALLPLVAGGSGVRATAAPLAAGALAIALGGGLTGAWLVPTMWFGPDTYITDPSIAQGLLGGTSAFAGITNVLAPWPTVPSPFRGHMWIYAQAPALAALWVVLALAMTARAGRRRGAGPALAAASGLLLVALALLLLIVNRSWWPGLPQVVQIIQMPMRLIPYLALAVALAVAVAMTVVSPPRTRRLLMAALVLAIAVQTANAVWIVSRSKASATLQAPLVGRAAVRAAGEPASFSGAGELIPLQFRVMDRPTGSATNATPVRVRMPGSVPTDAAMLQAAGAVGERFATDIVWSPLVRVAGGARLAGRTNDGMAVVAVTSAAAGRWTATVTAPCTVCLAALSDHAPWPLVLGRLLTLLSALSVIAAALLAIRRRRRRGRARSEHGVLDGGQPAGAARPGALTGARR